ncbi:S1 RNA-binding domain-containing protein [Streptomyces inhibens]|uniref:S1 RNA-binding domain-containing protein n=1 Tax=Streptomyces inhibens TaxID=2293571 RepID=UPI0036955F80
MLSHCYRITKYDPADRDEQGRYTGSEDPVSDRGPVEAAHLRAVAAFAVDSGVDRLVIREPSTPGSAFLGAEPVAEGCGLAGLFPSDLSGYHDGAEVALETALELVRVMLREDGAWCRLEAEGIFTVHVGRDQYLYVGSARPCERAVALTRSLGLFPESIAASPYEWADDEPGPQQAADDDFWHWLYLNIPRNGALLLEEEPFDGVCRWHRVSRDNVGHLRAGLTPRARLAVWPDLHHDVSAVLDSLPDEGLVECVLEDRTGRIAGVVAAETQFAELAALVEGARAAVLLPMDLDERRPLFTAVLPDEDGVLRARWRTCPTPLNDRWALLKTFRQGQVRSGTVTSIAGFGVFVDIGGIDGMISAAELSWDRFERFEDVVRVGQELTVEILDVDLVRERIALSLKATQADTWLTMSERVGQVFTTHVTKVVPFGVFVCVEGRREGLVPNADFYGGQDRTPDVAVGVGDEITVRLVDVDLERRRILLTCHQVDQ